MQTEYSFEPDKETLAILRLSFCRGVGDLALHRLLEAFGSACAVFNAARDALSAVDGISENLAASIRTGPDEDALETELDLLERCKTRLIGISGDFYPEPLKLTGLDAPPLLRVRGEYRDRDRLALGLVGSRNCTHYGRSQARRFSMELAGMGFTIVSGHARGIDTECHRAALQAGGRTLAVLGCGLARLDKLSEPELALDIAENGALISELPMQALPLARHFPPRNRLISGLSAGVIVIQAGRRSGSLITARCAGEQGKSVFAIPGSVASASSRGCHQLIRDGAVLTETPGQVLDELGPLSSPVCIPEDIEEGREPDSNMVENPRQVELNDREKQVLRLVEHEPRLLDDLVEDSQLPVAVISSTLTALEINGLVTRLDGDRFVRGSG